MAAVCASVSLTPEKMKTVPIKPAVMEPSGLNACEKLRRRSLTCGSELCNEGIGSRPSRKDKPLAMTNCATRKKMYSPACAAG